MSSPTVGEFLDFMADTVTINAWTGQSVSGVPTYSSSAVTYPAYIEMKNHFIIGSEGRQVMAKGRVFLGTNAMVSVKDKITLPAEYVPASPPILAVNRANDEGGSHHTTLEIG